MGRRCDLLRGRWVSLVLGRVLSCGATVCDGLMRAWRMMVLGIRLLRLLSRFGRYGAWMLLLLVRIRRLRLCRCLILGRLLLMVMVLLFWCRLMRCGLSVFVRRIGAILISMGRVLR